MFDAMPNPTPSFRPTPLWTWEMLERELTDLTTCPVRRAMVKDCVSGIRKQAPFLPPARVLREVLCLAWVMLDEQHEFDSSESSSDRSASSG